MVMSVSGNAAPSAAPTAINGSAAWRAAKARTRSWLLSPNSAMKMAPRASAAAPMKDIIGSNASGARRDAYIRDIRQIS